MTVISDQLRSQVVSRVIAASIACSRSPCKWRPFPVDHFLPRCRGGLSELENLALACPACNACKWTHIESVDEVTGQVVELYHPRRHQWQEHFRWRAGDLTVLEPLTPIARATVSLLELNSPAHLAIRRWLMVIGQHPPN